MQVLIQKERNFKILSIKILPIKYLNRVFTMQVLIQKERNFFEAENFHKFYELIVICEKAFIAS